MSATARRRTRRKTSEEQSYGRYAAKTRLKPPMKRSLVDQLKTLLKWSSAAAVIAVVIVFFVSPAVFCHSATVRQLFVFMNYVNYPLFKNLSDPKNSFQLNCTRNLYLTTEDDDQWIRLGVWHTLPLSRREDCLRYNHSIDPLVAFEDKRPVFLYLHGNGGARGGHHRRQLYDLLSQSSQLDAHVVAFDYRGYGDSTNVWPSAEGLRRDTGAVYDWLLSQKHVHRERVIIWGHSLGTAVAISFLSRLPKAVNPRSVILEAPFTTMADAVKNYPLSVLYRKYYPYFEAHFVEPIVSDEVTNFDSISKLPTIEIPLLILHSEDDRLVPFHLGHTLYERSLVAQPTGTRRAQLVAFDGQSGYGHKYMCNNPKLPVIIEKFIQSND